MSDMMEQMLRNPEMQKMLYPYLPEPMRNPQVRAEARGGAGIRPGHSCTGRHQEGKGGDTALHAAIVCWANGIGKAGA